MKCLAIGISTVSVIILILTSLTNVVGYQTVQTSQQKVIKERINQRELLFQTICDIANNKEIQRIILKSQMSRGIFPTSELPVLTKSQLKMMYFLGLILSKVISKSKIQSMVGKYQFNNQDVQKEINGVIEKNTILKAEMTQLKDSECDCKNDNSNDYPIICGILTIIFSVCFAILLPVRLIYDFFIGIFYGTFLESLVESVVTFFVLILDIILSPIIFLLATTLYLILFVYDCWDWAPEDYR